ncbi:transposase [Pseudarthrobacter sp. P1]|uniref:transposase n=1 Tax=Pseudarthrobacter sp. P1 TaxID=3418418 RepID=UPI003CF0709B
MPSCSPSPDFPRKAAAGSGPRQERLSREVRRRTDVVEIFPVRTALIRLWVRVLHSCRAHSPCPLTRPRAGCSFRHIHGVCGALETAASCWPFRGGSEADISSAVCRD